MISNYNDYIYNVEQWLLLIVIKIGAPSQRKRPGFINLLSSELSQIEINILLQIKTQWDQYL